MKSALTIAGSDSSGGAGIQVSTQIENVSKKVNYQHRINSMPFGAFACLGRQ